MLVAVGSTNPTKVSPVKQVFDIYFPGSKVTGVAVDSGVSDQPKNINEMYNGAKNRAIEAIKKIKDSDFGVGIEGGLNKYDFGWFESSIIVIVDKNKNIGVGSSGGLVLPDKIINLIESGLNLEEAIDQIFKTEKIGQGKGMFGIMTKDVVTRTSGVFQGVAFAMSRFLHPKIFENK